MRIIKITIAMIAIFIITSIVFLEIIKQDYKIKTTFTDEEKPSMPIKQDINFQEIQRQKETTMQKVEKSKKEVYGNNKIRIEIE